MNTLRKKRHCSNWSLEPLLSCALRRDLQFTIFVFSVDDTFPHHPNPTRNGYHVLGTRYGEEKRFILKHRTCTFMCATYGNSINDFSSFGERPFTWSPKYFPKCVTWSRNTLRRKDKFQIQANSLYSHWEPLSTILGFLAIDTFPDLPKFSWNG